MTTGDSTKHLHSSDILHQSYHSPATEPPSHEDDPPVDLVAPNPIEQSEEDKKIQEELLDFNQRLATANHHASMNKDTLVTSGSAQMKPATTSIGTDPIDQSSGSSWGTPFNPNPQL